MWARHHSRMKCDRDPVGAVPAGAKVTLRLSCPAAQQVVLRLWETRGEVRVDMLKRPDGDVWETAIDTSGVPRVLWYWFEVFGRNSERLFYYGNNAQDLGGEGSVRLAEPQSFQITVYDPEFDVPEWLRDGVMVQIMVDRFNRSPEWRELVARRSNIRVHDDWYEPPYIYADERSGDNVANDFFGGNLKGITEKLPYLSSMGATVLYLNPIFKAHSNHKYDTGDYEVIDPTFGDEEDFRELCAEAKKLGMHIMLDGVFSHTGEDSKYFNRYGRYDSLGAYQSTESPYYSWYSFRKHPVDYECWWGVPTLPEVVEENPAYLNYIVRGKDAVAAKWIELGADGWRLDVADELPDEFLFALRSKVKSVNPNAAIMGEVWEDASHKVSYGKMRPYLLGKQLDNVMNYPLREALIGFLTGTMTSVEAARRIETLGENYPKPVFYSLMNLLGSHDRPRLVNVLSGAQPPLENTKHVPLSEQERALGLARAKMMLLLVASLPGMPCVYYGDEAGMEGWRDPFCRGTYPWGQEDTSHLSFFREVLWHRKHEATLRTGDFKIISENPDVLHVMRWIEGGKDVFGRPADNSFARCVVNRSANAVEVVMADGGMPMIVVGNDPSHVTLSRGIVQVLIPPESGALWVKKTARA